jgi:uncharacterized coiled-coil DUF342 family protein
MSKRSTDKGEGNDTLKAKTPTDETAAKKSVEELEEGFNALIKEIAIARVKRDELNSKSQEIIKALKENNSQVKEHIKRAQELKVKRDSCNESVQAAKNGRATTQATLEGLRKKLGEFKEKDKDNDARRAYEDIVAQIAASDQQSEKYHNDVILNSQESQNYHELMLKEFQVVDSLREKISMLEEELDDNRKKADEFHAQLVSNSKKREDIREEIIIKRREKLSGEKKA